MYINITWVLILITGSAFGQSLDSLYEKTCFLTRNGAYAEALKADMALLQKAELQKDCHQLSMALYKAGEINDLLRDNKESVRFLRLGLNAAVQCKDSNVIWLCTRYLGGHYLGANNRDSAWHYLQNAYELIKGTTQYARLASTTGMMGETQKECLGRMDEAERYHKISLAYALQSKDDNAIAYAYLRYGALQATRRNNCTEGIRCVETANNLFTQHHDVEGIYWSLKTLSNVYHKCGAYEKARETWIRLADAQDSVFSKQVADKTARYRTLYETEKKEKENALKDKQLQWERERARNQLVYFFITVAAITALFLIGYFRHRYRKKMETERRIADEQLKRFKAVVEAQETERGRIARELHDGVGHLLSSARLNASAIEDVTDENKLLVERTMDIIDEALVEARNISHNLMPAVLAELGLGAAIKQLVRKIVQTGKVNIVLHNEHLIPELEQARAVALYRIIQEVLNNSLKHSGADSIEILFEQTNGITEVRLNDNGKGFDIEAAIKSSGMGWKNIFSRVEMLSGKIVVNATPGAGTGIIITFGV